MYIRIADGRDCGRVMDVRDEEASIMLDKKQAASVDFNDPKWMETIPDFTLKDAQKLVTPPQQTEELPVSSTVDSEVRAQGKSFSRKTGRR